MSTMPIRDLPPQHVLVAFGSAGEPAPLTGGRGLAWRVGDLVFKPADLALNELAWQADVLPTVDAPDVRLSFPQRAVGGELVVDGWTAWPYLPGEHLYWRPPAFATAIVVADALVWEGADASLIEAVADVDDFGQMLARALLFRIVAAVEGGFEDDLASVERRYRQAVELALELVTRST